jgi:hypothetical protein
MNELSQIITGLRLTRPSLNAEQLLALVDPEPVAEQRVVAEVGLPYWIFSVNGSSFDGEFIVVRASLPSQADQLAAGGLRDTIAALRHHDANTGLQATVEMRPMQ